jgi:hypothetical protein
MERRHRVWNPNLNLNLARVTALVLTMVLLAAACGGGGAKLDATLLRLELRYPVSSQPDLRVTGEQSSAPGGSLVVCRSTGDKRAALGQASVNDDGSFELPLDAATFPISAIKGDFMALNRSLECRAGSGRWVSPLRPPLVAIG